MTRRGVNCAVSCRAGTSANPGETSCAEVTVNGSDPVSVTRTWNCRPIATSLRSRTASALTPGTSGSGVPGAADDEDDDEDDDDEDDDLDDDDLDEIDEDDAGKGDLRRAGEGPDQDDVEEDGVR